MQQDHARDAAVAQAQRLERAELADVLDGEEVERLPGDGRAHDQA